MFSAGSILHVTQVNGIMMSNCGTKGVSSALQEHNINTTVILVANMSNVCCH